jgi:N-acyl-L-homoserine lactone synthetase
MLHVCTHQNRHLYRQQLVEMHRQRNELFVKTRGWNLTVRNGGEYDEGDDERAVYLLSLDEAGDCYGSIRLRPADDFSMVIDKMGHHIAGDPNALRAEPGLWEMARWINIGGDAAAGQEIRIGLMEYLLSQGARQCLAIPDVGMLGYAIRTGWRLQPLGPPLPYPEGGEPADHRRRGQLSAQPHEPARPGPDGDRSDSAMGEPRPASDRGGFRS